MTRTAERGPPAGERVPERAHPAAGNPDGPPIRRHPGDVVRVVVGVVVLAVSAAFAGTARLSTFERVLFRLVGLGCLPGAAATGDHLTVRRGDCPPGGARGRFGCGGLPAVVRCRRPGRQPDEGDEGDRVYAADVADALEKLMLGTARRIVLSPVATLPPPGMARLPMADGPSRTACGWSTPRSTASSTSATPRRSTCCAPTATASTRWRARCSSTRPSTRRTPTGPAGSPPRPRPPGSWTRWPATGAPQRRETSVRATNRA